MLRLRNLILIAACAALAAGGVAVAKRGPASASAVNSSITATTASVKVKNCTATDGTIERTKGTYTGNTTAGSAGLTGAVTARVDSWFNLTTHIGQLSAKLTIGGPGTIVKLTAVNNNNAITGWVTGRTTDGKRLTGTASGTWTRTSGFTSLQIGSGSATNFAFTASGKCTGTSAPTGPTGASSAAGVPTEVQGTVSAVSPQSITVAGTTCAVPTRLAQKVARLRVGDRVRIKCELVNGQPTLVKVKRQS